MFVCRVTFRVRRQIRLPFIVRKSKFGTPSRTRGPHPTCLCPSSVSHLLSPFVSLSWRPVVKESMPLVIAQHPLGWELVVSGLFFHGCTPSQLDGVPREPMGYFNSAGYGRRTEASADAPTPPNRRGVSRAQACFFDCTYCNRRTPQTSSRGLNKSYDAGKWSGASGRTKLCCASPTRLKLGARTIKNGNSITVSGHVKEFFVRTVISAEPDRVAVMKVTLLHSESMLLS